MGVVAVDRFGYPDLVSFEKALLARARSLPGGETNIKCSLTHGSLEVDGFLWDRAGRSDCKSWRFEKGASFTGLSAQVPRRQGRSVVAGLDAASPSVPQPVEHVL